LKSKQNKIEREELCSRKQDRKKEEVSSRDGALERNEPGLYIEVWGVSLKLYTILNSWQRVFFLFHFLPTCVIFLTP
jgi:hypothetical protein